MGAPLPPNKDDFTTVVSRPGISQEQFTKLMQTDDAIDIFGEITYHDSYGEKYETTFCLSHLFTGAIKYRKEGNGIN